MRYEVYTSKKSSKKMKYLETRKTLDGAIRIGANAKESDFFWIFDNKEMSWIDLSKI